MKLKSLSIERRMWEPGKPLQGYVEFMDDRGEIKIQIDDDSCNKMIGIVAEALVDHSRKVAQDLTATILIAAAEATPQLEDKDDIPF